MNDDEGYMIHCPRCGSEMKSNSRYCMKCGYLNTDHPLNNNLNKVFKKLNKNNKNANKFINNVNVGANEISGNDSFNVRVGFHIGNSTLCFRINLGVYLLVMLLTTLIMFLSAGSFQDLLVTNIGVVYIVISVIFFYIYSFQLLFMKMDLPWYGGLIPILNLFLLTDALFPDHKYLKYINLIPGIGQLFQLVLLYKLGVAFGKSPLFVILLFPLMLPVIVYGSSSYNEVYFTSKESNIEKEFGNKKNFSTLCAFFIMLGVFASGYKLYAGGLDLGTIERYYVYKVSNKAMEETIKIVDTEKYTCYEGESDTFYFYYANVSDYFTNPLDVFTDPISIYIKVVKESDGYEYYISATNGKYGFKEINASELDLDIVKKYKELKKLNEIEETGNLCYF